jgi:putative transcriptional regulator
MDLSAAIKFNPPDVPPEKGVLLLAGGGLLDPNFARSVVLLCEHADEGSFGLVLNQPLELKLSDGFPQLEGWDAPLYRGGPVQARVLNFLHRRADLDIGSREIVPGIFWGGDFDAVSLLMQRGETRPEDFRFFAGYSGWGEGQLQNEIERKDWYLTQAAGKLIFQENARELWRSVLRGMGYRYAIYANLPVNTQLN